MDSQHSGMIFFPYFIAGSELDVYLSATVSFVEDLWLISGLDFFKPVKDFTFTWVLFSLSQSFANFKRYARSCLRSLLMYRKQKRY